LQANPTERTAIFGLIREIAFIQQIDDERAFSAV
jgi:hypothetical protein